MDAGFTLPDDVWSIPETELGDRLILTDELCILDGRRHFLRAVAYTSVAGGQDEFGWGLWAQPTGGRLQALDFGHEHRDVVAEAEARDAGLADPEQR